MNIGDKVSILQDKVGKRGKVKKVIVDSGTIIDFTGTVGFGDDELVCAVKTESGQIKEFVEDELSLKDK